MEKQAIPLCLPNNCTWDPITGEYSQQEEQDRQVLTVISQALERLRVIKGPVCVVSIAGPCRKGKSYILSKAFGQGEVFPLGHSLDPETMGIWMWIVPEKYKDVNGEEFTVVLLDSEGIDAVTGEKMDDHRIFTLTVLLASVLIYNSAGVPTRKDLEDLDFIVKLSQRVQMGNSPEGSSDNDTNLLHRTFPFFIWLLRDVVLDVPKTCTDIKDYFLKRVFKTSKCQTAGASDKGCTAAQQAAESILSFFPGFDAFSLPPPSTSPKVTQNLNSSQDGINKEFLKGVEVFTKDLGRRLMPKRSFTDGEFVTGEALAVMAELYIDALNTPGTVPNIKSTWDTFVQNKCTEATIAAFHLYNDIMTSQVKELLPCDTDDLRTSHMVALERALELFEGETRGISAFHIDKYMRDWKDKAEENLTTWQKKNDQATDDFCVDLLQNLKQQHLEPVLAQLTSPEGSRMTFAKIIEAYSCIEMGFKTHAKGAKDVCARAFFNFHPELKAEMEKHVEHLQQLRDYDEKLAQERAARASEEEERRRMEEENKRLDQERKRKEREMEILKEKQNEDRRRLEEQFRENMEIQREQMENMMTANMEQIKQDREAMLSQNKTLEDALERMNESMVNRNAEIQRLQEQITALASRPPPKPQGKGGCIIL